MPAPTVWAAISNQEAPHLPQPHKAGRQAGRSARQKHKDKKGASAGAGGYCGQ